MALLTNWYWFKTSSTQQLAAWLKLKQYQLTLIECDYYHQGQASELVTNKIKAPLYLYFKFSKRKFILISHEAESVQDVEIDWTDCFICQKHGDVKLVSLLKSCESTE